MTFLVNRVKAFRFAGSGIRQAFKRETHLKLHVFIGAMVCGLGFYFSISTTEWLMVLGCITLVTSLELVNSAIEALCDRLVPETDGRIKYVKDVSAGAVLLASVFALITGIIVFVPYARF